jgi:outer membrane biogenesis lipoprotein LolB
MPYCGWFRRTISVLVLAAIAGCASPTMPPPSPDDGPVHNWSGRFAASWILSSGADTERASGSFQLRQQRDTVRLEVYSPFGQTLARASSSAQGATLETSNGKSYQAENPEILTERVLGWRIPVASLPLWLRELGNQQQPKTSFTDSGWAVVFDASNTSAARMTLRWPAAPVAGEPRQVTIRLVVEPAQ